MNNKDRAIMLILAGGVWALVILNFFSSSLATAEEPRSRYFIRSAVENCSVSGEVYIYDKQGGCGEIESGSLSC